MQNKSMCPLCKKDWSRCKCNLKKDFGVEIGTKESAAWKNIYEGAVNTLMNNKISDEINTIIRDLAKKRMEEEKGKI